MESGPARMCTLLVGLPDVVIMGLPPLRLTLNGFTLSGTLRDEGEFAGVIKDEG